MLRVLSVGTALIAALVLGACGFGGDSDSTREKALASLELSTEAAALEDEMGRLVKRLSKDPSAAERQRLQGKLARLERRAANIVSRAGTESTYDVVLEPLNGSETAGSATLVVADGEMAIEGSLRGIQGGKARSVVVHALGRGASICPPEDASSGSDEQLSGSEAEDFYGRPVVRLALVKPGKAQDEVKLAATAPAGKASPLTARAVVVSGGKGKEGFEADLPVACGVPVAQVVTDKRTPTAEVVAGTQETRAALLHLSVALDDPATRRAKTARNQAERRLAAANEHLRGAVKLARDDLESGGEVAGKDRREIDQALAQLKGSSKESKGALKELEKLIEQALEAKQERIAQRRSAQEAAKTPEPAPAPAPAPAPTPAPEPSPETAPPPGDGDADCALGPSPERPNCPT